MMKIRQTYVIERIEPVEGGVVERGGFFIQPTDPVSNYPAHRPPCGTQKYHETFCQVSCPNHKFVYGISKNISLVNVT